MKFSLRTLAIGFGVLLVTYAGLAGIERKVAASKVANEANDQIGPRVRGQAGNEANRQRLKRARKLSSAEAWQFLQYNIIPKIDFEDVSLEEAVEILNEEIAKQLSGGQARPAIRIDPQFLKSIKERRARGDVGQADLEAALGGLTQAIGLEAYRIPEMRMVNVPAAVALAEICDMTESTYFIYQGDCYLVGEIGSAPYVRFYFEEKLDRIKLQKVRLDQLESEIRELVSQHEYYGQKAGIEFRMSEKAVVALLAGEVSLPTISIEMENATMVDLMKSIIKLPNMYEVFDGTGEIVFDPFGEHAKYVSRLNPFDPDPETSNPFKVPLNEDWRDWRPSAQEPSE